MQKLRWITAAFVLALLALALAWWLIPDLFFRGDMKGTRASSSIAPVVTAPSAKP